MRHRTYGTDHFARRRLPTPALAAAALAWAVLFGLEGWGLSGQRFGTFYYERGKVDPRAALKALGHEALGGAFWVVTFSRDNAVLTRDDLRAFDWIRRETPPGAVFDTNYGDGGNMIPSAAHRKVLDPHYHWFFHQEEMKRWRERTRADYIYAGADPSPAWPRKHAPEALDLDPGVELVFRSGQARVYRVKGGR